MPATAEAPKTAKKEEPLRVFKLLSSEHIGVKEGWTRPVDEKTGKPLFNDPETGAPIMPPKHKYRWDEPGNNIVRDRRDLVKIFGEEKFKLISGDPGITEAAAEANNALIADNEALRNMAAEQQARIAALEAELGLQNAPSTVPGIDGMTKAQLVAYAQENGIDLGDARSKDEILSAIKNWSPEDSE